MLALAGRKSRRMISAASGQHQMQLFRTHKAQDAPK
jgi:hypothetical protein